MDLNKLSPNALKAAMTGGTTGWGHHGSVENFRYAEEKAKSERRKKCCCGCGKWSTHRGVANGITLMSGCEFYVARWVKDWRAILKTPQSS